MSLDDRSFPDAEDEELKQAEDEENSSAETVQEPEIIEPTSKEELPEPVKNAIFAAPTESHTTSGGKKLGKHEIRPMLLGKSINSLLKLLERKYPQLTGELELDELEMELIDDALKRPLEKLLKKSDVSSDIVSLIFAVIAIAIPRIIVIFDASQNAKKSGK